MKEKLIFFLLCMVFFTGCFISHDISTENVASIYRESDHAFHPEITFFNDNDSSILIFVRIKPEEFLFARQQDEKYRSFIKIQADLIRSYEDVKVLDTASAEFVFDIEEKKGAKLLTFKMDSGRNGSYLIRFTIIDKIKGFTERFIKPYERFPINSRYDFVSMSHGSPIFKNYLNQDDSISLFFRDSTISTVWCKYYKREFPLPAPPFSFNVRDEFNYHPDSIFLLNINDGAPFTLHDEGFYHLQIDSASKKGYTLYRFNQGYPLVTTPSQMVESIRYLTSKKEFEDLKKTVSLRNAVDNFWLKRGNNNPDKSRNLIKKYYNRVQEANKYFTSYTEGWRTDRGMMYIIFGPPSTIYKGENSENWIYGSAGNALSLNLLFVKVDNPFSDNDYTLTRSPLYESHWYRAVEIWRQGRAYNSFY